MSHDQTCAHSLRERLIVPPILLFSLASATAADSFTAILDPPGPPNANDFFGSSCAVHSDIAAIGATGADGAQSDTGVVNVFERSAHSWTHVQSVSASDGAPVDEFGSAVVISNQTLVVGAPKSDSAGPSSGAVYVYERVGNVWVETAKLLPSDVDPGDRFGAALALSGDTLAVGSPGDADVVTASGAVYVFARSAQTWVEQHKLYPSVVNSSANFGAAVSLDGGRLAVGAPFAWGADLFTHTGATFIFEYDGFSWPEVAKLLVPGGQEMDGFGTAVAIDGHIVAASAPLFDSPSNAAGVVGVYERTQAGWGQTQTLNASDATAGDTFGSAIDLSSSYLAVGATGEDTTANNAGAVYVFRSDGQCFSEMTKVVTTAVSSDAHLGASVALMPDGRPTLIAGADRNSVAAASFAGRAIAHEINDTMVPSEYCEAVKYCDAAPNSAGNGAVLSVSGTLSVAANALTINASGVPGLELGQFFYGTANQQLPAGDGFLCIGGATFRLPPQQANANGSIAHSLDFSMPPHPAGQITPDSLWYFQLWYRDSAAANTGYNFSDAIRILFCN